MINYIKYFIYFLFTPFWWIQLIIPRKKNTWLFGAWYGKKFADNTKVLFEYVVKHNPEIVPIWLTHDQEIYNNLCAKGLQVAKINSLKAIYYSLTASKIIVSSGKVDVNRFFINGATIINTWHGAPMKKIGLDDKFANTNKTKDFIFKLFFPFIWEYNVDFVVSTASTFSNKMGSAFNLPENRVLETGYPRCDLFFKQDKHRLTLNINKQFNSPNKIIYLPTFRSVKDRFNPFKSFNFNESDWCKFLESSNSVLISKGHFVDKYIGATTNCKRLIHISDNDVPELNEFLKDCDLLITDYSGVYFDFLLTDKPIILSPFDFDDYVSNSRQLYFNYEDIACGPIAKSWDEILDLLKDVSALTNNQEYFKQKSLFNKYHNANNSERLVKRILYL